MQDARLAGRLHKELKMLQDPPPGVCVWPAEEHSLSRLEAQIQGPDGTVYSKGIFKLEVEIPDRYPFEPPNVKFVTPVYHPNIDSGGRICHDILNMPPKGQWRPSLNIGAVLSSIRVLLAEPNHDDGLMSDISAEYKHSRVLFDKKARLSTERYAMQNTAVGDTEGSQDSDLVRASASPSTSSKNQAIEIASRDTLARPLLKEVSRMGASKVTLDEPSTSSPMVADSSFTLARPRQSFAAKLSLTKRSTPQSVRTGHGGGAAEPENTIPLTFSSERDRALEMEVPCGTGSRTVSQPSGGSGGEDADTACRNDSAICSIIKDKELNAPIFTSQICQRIFLPERGKKAMLPKTKVMKLSRHQGLAPQSAQEITQTCRLLLGPHSTGAAQFSKDPVIFLDSESDGEDFRYLANSGVKGKHGLR